MAVTSYGELARTDLFDPARGAFDPVLREPPNGVMHQDKTRQDRMPVDKRPRVLAAIARREAMR